MGWIKRINRIIGKSSSSGATSAGASTGTTNVGGPAYAPSTGTSTGTAGGKTPQELEREKEEQLRGIVQTYEPPSDIEESAKKDAPKSFRKSISNSLLFGSGSPLKKFRKKLLGF